MGKHSADEDGQEGGETSYGFQPNSENTYDEPGNAYEDYFGEHAAEYMGNQRKHRAEDRSWHPNYNPNHQSDGDKSYRPRHSKELKDREERTNRASEAPGSIGRLSHIASAEASGNELGENKRGSFFFNKEKGKFSGARGFLQKHRKKLVAGGLVGAGILPIIALILFLMAALKIPHFVENVAAWRFAKLTRQYRASVNNVIGEKNALDSLSDADYKAATQRYGKFKVFDGINRLRPNRVLQSMQAADRIQYDYRTTFTGRQKLVSITLSPDQDFKSRVTIDVPSGRFDRLIHPFQTLDKYKTIADAVDSAMRAHDPKIPVLTRTLATKAVLEKAGASLKGMVASKYIGKNTQGPALQKIYEDLVANASKYNDLLQKYNALVDQYNTIYAQKQDFYKAEWLPVYNDWLTAKFDWDIAYHKLQLANGSPSQELMDEIAAAGDKYKSVSEEFSAKKSVLKDFYTQIDVVYKDMIGTFDELQTLRQERLKLTQDYTAEGGTLSDRDAKIAIEQETFDVAHRNGGIGGLVTDNEKQTAQQVDDAATAARNDPATLGQMVDSGADVPDTVDKAVQSALNPDSLSNMAKSVVGAINPVYDIAVPVCMAYEGSKITSESIDAQHDSKVSEAAFVISTNDELKDGRNMNTTMANAMNWKLGDVQSSNAMDRVNGKPVNTLDQMGMGQRSPLGTYGEYTIFDVIHLHMLNGMADTLCPKLTNFWLGLGIGVGNLVITGVLSIFSGGGAGAGEATVTRAAEQAADDALTTIVKKMVVSATKKTIRGFAKSGRFAKQFAKDSLKYGAATAAATFLASMIVRQAAGSFNSGYEHSVSFDDNVDDGSEQLSGDMGRANYYARPLNNSEAANSHAADRQEAIYYNEHLSTYDRYFALSNPNSLVSRGILTTGSLLNKSIFASLLNSIASVFNPIGLSSHLFATANAQTAIAGGNTNTEDYGNVVWGYSNAEIALMSNDPTYSSPSENSDVLDKSGKRDEIEAKYSVCYNASIGQLLETHKIQREENTGNVTNSGDCSPEQLGPNNPQYGDLVFRWRLEHNYENTSDALLNIQDPSTSTSSIANLGNIPSGTAQQLAQQIINNGHISFQLPSEKADMQYIAQTGHARDCGAPAVSPILLGVLLAAAQKYNIVVGVLDDGHGCDGGFHPKGMAMDINGVNAPDGSSGTGRFITAADYSSNKKILVDFYNDMGGLLAQAGGGGMGQYQCWGSPPAKNAKVTYFPDTCDHLHVDVGHR